MLTKAKATGLTISRTLVQVADYHFNEASQWWDMYNHCLTEGATFEGEDGKDVAVPDGLVHPDFLKYAKKYLAKYKYHLDRADYIIRTGQGQRLATVKPKNEAVDYAAEFEKAVEQRGEMAKAEFEAKRKARYVQRKKANRENPVETLH